MTHKKTSSNMEQCIKHCSDCHRACKETMMHCLGIGGKHAEQSHIKTMLECAELCKASAGFMIMGSDLHKKNCGVCAEACELCEKSCEKTGKDDEHMKACAEMCEKCAESCRKMA